MSVSVTKDPFEENIRYYTDILLRGGVGSIQYFQILNLWLEGCDPQPVGQPLPLLTSLSQKVFCAAIGSDPAVKESFCTDGETLVASFTGFVAIGTPELVVVKPRHFLQKREPFIAPRTFDTSCNYKGLQIGVFDPYAQVPKCLLTALWGETTNHGIDIAIFLSTTGNHCVYGSNLNGVLDQRLVDPLQTLLAKLVQDKPT